jgi:glutamyl-tRNA synthetase
MSVSWSDLADALFPDVELSIQDYIQQYPERDVPVTRFAPSPTGFLHIGGVFSAFLAHKYIKQE